MENQAGKEDRMRLEYQAKRDLGFQSMGHGEQGTFSNDMSKQSTGNSYVKAVIMVLASQNTYGTTFLY